MDSTGSMIATELRNPSVDLVVLAHSHWQNQQNAVADRLETLEVCVNFGKAVGGCS